VSHLVFFECKDQHQIYAIDPFSVLFTHGVFVTTGEIIGDGVAGSSFRRAFAEPVVLTSIAGSVTFHCPYDLHATFTNTTPISRQYRCISSAWPGSPL
jgi:hypothetical protein